MASTVNQIVSKFRQDFYPDCAPAKAEALWQEAWNRAVHLFRLREAAVTIPLTPGTREYDLPGTVAAVREAYYEPSAEPTEWRALSGTSVDALARTEAGWQASADGVPVRFYVRTAADEDSGKRVIGFDPIPIIGTEGTYPRIRLHAVQRAELTGTETVPDFLLSDEWFLYEMAYRYAIRQDRGVVAQWMQLRDDEQAKWSAYLRGSADEVPGLLLLSQFTNQGSRTV
jgi:hypothetical protein